MMYALTLFSLTYSAITATYADDVTTYHDALDYSRAVFEIISYTMACFTLLTEFNQLRRYVSLRNFYNYP